MEIKSNNIKNNKKTKASNRKKIFRLVFGSLLIATSLALGVIASTFHSLLNTYNQNTEKKISLGSIQGIQQAVSDLKQISSPIEEPMNILILGSDISYSHGKADNGSPTRSDTMMLAHIDPIKKQVNILSIPRDTRFLIPEKRYYDKINAAFAYGGERLARKTVANLTGSPIHHFVALKVDGLVNIIDILGGIEINVEKNMHYVDHTAKLNINIKKGVQTLNGEQAHEYVRFRHDEIGDIGRVQRQQHFLDAVATKMLNPATIVKLPKLVDSVQKNIVTDMSNPEMLKVGNFLRTIKRSQIKMVMLPGHFGSIGGASYWLIDEDQKKDLIKDMFPDSTYNTEATPSSSPSLIASSSDPQNNNQDISSLQKRKYRITVLNGTDEPRLAARAARFLRDKGWSVWSVSEAKNAVEKTQIVVQTGKSVPVPYLQEALGVQAEVINQSVGDIYTDYTITVGKDFAVYLKQKQDEMVNKGSLKKR